MREIFESFEVNASPFWPILGKLAGVSVAFHAVVIASIIFVPPVRDAVNVAALFSHNGGFVDRAYVATSITDEAQMISLPTDKFRYPDGYWYAENGLPIPSEPMVVPTPAPIPTPTPVAVVIPKPRRQR